MEGVVLTGLGVAFVFYASFGRSAGGDGGRVGTFYFGVDLDWVGGFSLVVHHRQLFHDCYHRVALFAVPKCWWRVDGVKGV